MRKAAGFALFMLFTVSCDNDSPEPVDNNCFKVTNEHVEILENYMSANQTEVILSESVPYNSLNIYDQDLKNHEVFLTGESHGTVANYQLELHHLKYFNQNAGIKYYLLEIQVSTGKFLNLYLENGDLDLLRQIFNALKGTSAYSNENFQHWRNVYEFNRSLPDSAKITVIGIDVAHQNETALRYLDFSIPDNITPPISIVNLIDEVKNRVLNGDFHANLESFIQDLLTSIDQNRSDYEDFLGDELFYFEWVAQNIIQKFDFQDSGFRDQFIYSNFLKIYPKLAPGKFYGQWGSRHIYQGGNQDGKTYFADALQHESSSPVTNKVLSTIYWYNDSFSMSSDNQSTLTNDSNVCFEPDFFTNLTQANLTLFKLNGDNTPFQSTFEFSSGITYSGILTDIFQYAAVINNSPAVTPYSP